MPDLAYLDVRAGIKITAPSGGQASCNFTTVDPAGIYRPLVGEPVHLYSNATRIFGGYIVEVVEYWDPATSCMRNKVACGGYSIILDRRLFSGEFTFDNSGTLLAILNIIRDEILVDEILDFGTISTAITMTATDRFQFSTSTLREVFNQLAEFFEVDWTVDWYGVIDFTAGTAAPFNLIDNDGNALAEPMPRLTNSVGNYANRIAVKSSQSLTSLRTECYIVGVDPWFSGNRDIPTQYEITDWPTVTIEGPLDPGPVQQTIGQVIGNGQIIDTSGNVSNNFRYWWRGLGGGGFTKHLVANSGYATLPDGWIVCVTYPGPVSSSSSGNFIEDADEIAARAAIEGSSGKYDRAEDVAGINSPTTVTSYAEGLLAKLAVMPKDFEFSTDRLGLMPGQNISINLSRPLVNATFWIESVSAFDKDATLLRWNIKATTGRVRRTIDFVRLFSTIIEKVKKPPAKDQHITKWHNARATLVTGTNVGGTQYIQRSGWGSYVEIACDTPPVGSAVIVDVLRNGVSCLAAPVGFLPGVGKSVSYNFAVNPFYFEKDDAITYDILQVGLTTAGGSLWVNLVIHG